jgi:hypothetical protein
MEKRELIGPPGQTRHTNKSKFDLEKTCLSSVPHVLVATGKEHLCFFMQKMVLNPIFFIYNWCLVMKFLW